MRMSQKESDAVGNDDVDESTKTNDREERQRKREENRGDSFQSADGVMEVDHEQEIQTTETTEVVTTTTTSTTTSLLTPRTSHLVCII